jgi:hypothetical protein
MASNVASTTGPNPTMIANAMPASPFENVSAIVNVTKSHAIATITMRRHPGDLRCFCATITRRASDR